MHKIKKIIHRKLNYRQDKDKTDGTKLEASKGTSSSKTESSRETSESALSESKTSTSSQVSAPDDFVMVELVSYLKFLRQFFVPKIMIRERKLSLSHLMTYYM
jgi:hypothetical protein